MGALSFLGAISPSPKLYPRLVAEERAVGGLAAMPRGRSGSALGTDIDRARLRPECRDSRFAAHWATGNRETLPLLV